MRALIPLTAAVLSLLPLAAWAESDLAPGSFHRQTRHWYSASNSFLPGAESGEGEACWQVVARSKIGVTLKHVSGRYAPFWSDKPIAPGSIDEWFDSDAFREDNPGKPPLTQIRAIFETVASCHETS